MSLFASNYLTTNTTYTLDPPQTGGLVVNVDPDPGTQTTVAGAAFSGAATVVTTAGGVFSAGDLILISGANTPANDGVFEVLSHVGTTLTIRGAGATVEDFTKDVFTPDAVAAGTITKTSVSVMRANSTGGTWAFGSGDATPITFLDVVGTPGGGATYEEFTHVTTWGGPFAAPIAGNVRLTLFGRNVTADFVGTGGQSQRLGAITMTTPFPDRFRPFADREFTVSVTNNSSNTVGILLVRADGTARFFADASSTGFAGPILGPTGTVVFPVAAFQDVSVSWTV